jgi:hypothetical protein
MISRDFADNQLRRMMGIPYFRRIGAEGFAELLRVAVETARQEIELTNAITALLANEARASNRETNVPPTPGELVRWIRQQQPEDAYAEQTQTTRGFCDLCRHGRPPGWITRTRIIKGNHYEFAGKCPRCNPGWYGGGAA